MKFIKKESLKIKEQNEGIDCAVVFDILCPADQRFLKDFTEAQFENYPISVNGEFYKVKRNETSITFHSIIFLLESYPLDSSDISRQ